MTHLNRRFLALALFLAAIVSGSCAVPAFASSVAAAQAATADADKVDINTATADQLKAIKGIGEAYSKRIIAGRPYTAKNQLNTRGILPPATYNAIKDQIIAKAPKK
jgi:competence protein ComEA